MELDDKTKDLFAKEKMGKLLFMMSFPVIIAVAISAIYNIVDTIFIGKSVGILGVAGIGIGFPIQLIVNSIGLLFGLGGMSVISRFLGAGKTERATKAIGQTYVLGLIFFLLITLTLPFMDTIIAGLGANAEVAPYAREYLIVIIPGSFFILTAISAGNLFMAQGKTRTCNGSVGIWSLVEYSPGSIVYIRIQYGSDRCCHSDCIESGGITDSGTVFSVFKINKFISEVQTFCKNRHPSNGSNHCYENTWISSGDRGFDHDCSSK